MTQRAREVVHEKTIGDSRHEGLQWRRLHPLLLVALGVMAYLNSLRAPFIFDDLTSIVQNLNVHKILPVGVTDRAIVDLTFKFNYALGGLKVADYHVVNIAIHVLAALVLYGVVRRTLRLPSLVKRFGTSADGLAFAVAVIWMLHPLQTESVTYICQRYESLMGLFFLLTLYGFVRAQGSWHPRLWYDVSLLSCLLGMGTKSVMIAAPFVVLCFDHVFVATSGKEVWKERGRYHVALFLMLGVLFVLVGRMLHAATEAGYEAVARITPRDYLFTQFGVILHYLRLSAWPHPLCFDYAWPAARGWRQILLPGLAVVSLGLVSLWGLWRKRWWGFLGAWFFLILGPSSSIMPIQDMAFEHRMYLPLAAVVVLVVVCYFLFVYSRGTRNATVTAIVLVGLIGVLMLMTVQRNEDYLSPERLWRSVVRVQRDNLRAANDYAIALSEANKFEEAQEEYMRILRCIPGKVKRDIRRGTVARQKTLSTHSAAYHYFRAHANVGQLIQQSAGSREDALHHYVEALRVIPSHAGLRHKAQVLLREQGVPARDRDRELDRRIFSGMTAVSPDAEDES